MDLKHILNPIDTRYFNARSGEQKLIELIEKRGEEQNIMYQELVKLFEKQGNKIEKLEEIIKSKEYWIRELKEMIEEQEGSISEMRSFLDDDFMHKDQLRRKFRKVKQIVENSKSEVLTEMKDNHNLIKEQLDLITNDVGIASNYADYMQNMLDDKANFLKR